MLNLETLVFDFRYWSLRNSHRFLIFRLFALTSLALFPFPPSTLFFPFNLLFIFSLVICLCVCFSLVSGVHLSAASSAIVLDHDYSSPSVGSLSSEPIISSPEITNAENSIVNQTVPKTQVNTSIFL